MQKKQLVAKLNVLLTQKQEKEQIDPQVLQDETAEEKTAREAQIADIDNQIQARDDEIEVLNAEINKFTLCNINKAPGFLPEDSPDFLYTQTYNNNYDISYGYLSSCMGMDETEALFVSANRTNQTVIQGTKGKGKANKKGKGGKKGRGKPKTSGGAGGSGAVGGGAGGSGAGGGGAGDGATLNLRKGDIDRAYHSNEVIRTVSSCMETPFWGTCSYQDANSKCNMPNAKRTPDVVIAGVPENNTKYIRFPLLTCEVCGSKPVGPRNNQKFDGLLATMQSLVFCPRGYYWEIGTTEVRIYKLQKVPEGGFIKIHEKVYDLIEEVPENPPDNQFPGMTEMISDLCAILLDGLINLAPICLNTANCLTAANYKDFLNIPSVTRRKIEPHCWHIFVPQFLADQQKVHYPYRDHDAEDPQKPTIHEDELVKKDHVPTEAEVQAEECVIPVDEDALDYSQIIDKGFYQRLPTMRSVRVGPLGEPSSVDDFEKSAKAAERNFSAHQAMHRVKELFRRQKMSGIQILEENEAPDQDIPLDITAHPDLAATTANQMKRMTILTVHESDEEVENEETLFEFAADGDTSVISGGGDNLVNVIFEIDDHGNLIKRAKRRHAQDPLLAAPKKHRFSVDPGTADFLNKIGKAKVLVYPGTPVPAPPAPAPAPPAPAPAPAPPAPAPAPPAPGPSGDPLLKKAVERISAEQRRARAAEKKRKEQEEADKLLIKTIRKRTKTDRYSS